MPQDALTLHTQPPVIHLLLFQCPASSWPSQRLLSRGLTAAVALCVPVWTPVVRVLVCLGTPFSDGAKLFICRLPSFSRVTSKLFLCWRNLSLSVYLCKGSTRNHASPAGVSLQPGGKTGPLRTGPRFLAGDMPLSSLLPGLLEGQRQ